MNRLTRIILATAFAASLFSLTGCDGKVSDAAASEAGKVLKKYQDQNR